MCIVLHCIVLYCMVWYGIVLRFHVYLHIYLRSMMQNTVNTAVSPSAIQGVPTLLGVVSIFASSMGIVKV